MSRTQVGTGPGGVAESGPALGGVAGSGPALGGVAGPALGGVAGSGPALGAVAGSGVAQPRLVIRQARYSDRAGIRDFLDGLSDRSRYLRFFTGTSPTSAGMLRILAGGDDRADVVLAIENGVIIGHAMAADTTGAGGTHVADIGVVVADACQGRGIGSALGRTVAARAQGRGATAAVMEVLAENRRMLAMIAHHWPSAHRQASGPYVTFHAKLPQPACGRLPQPGEERPRELLTVSR